MGINGNRGRQRKAILILAVLVLAVQAPLPGRASPVTRAEQERRRAEEEKSRAESEAQQLEEKLGQSRQKEQALEEELVRLLALKDILESDMEELKTQTGITARPRKNGRDSMTSLKRGFSSCMRRGISRIWISF